MTRESASGASGTVYAPVRFGIERYRVVLLAAGLILLMALPGLWRLDLRLDGHALVPPDDPAVAIDAQIKERFSQADAIVIFVESPGPEGILNTASLALVRKITLAVLDEPDITRRDVKSLATESRDRVASMDLSPYLSTVPDTVAAMQELREDIEATPILKGTLVAPDYSGASIVVQVPRGADRDSFYDRIRAIVASMDTGHDHLHIVGAPVAESQLGNHLLTDLARQLPVCGALLVWILWLAFRRAGAIAVVFAQVGACLLLTFGLMGWSGTPLYITTAVLPVILCTMGVASEVHMLVALQRDIPGCRPAGDAELALAVMSHVQRPVAITVLTTAIGFASFVLSDLPPVVSFGVWATLGTLFSLAWSLLVTPALYRALGVRHLDRRLPAVYMEGAMGWIDRCTHARMAPLWTLAVGLVLALGVLRLQVQDGWISGFSRASAFHQSMERVNRSMLGTHLLQVELDFPGHTQALHDPGVIQAIGRMEDALRVTAGVGGVTGPYGQLSGVRYLMNGRAEGSDVVRDDRRGIQRLWHQMGVGRGADRRSEVVDEERQRGLLTIYLKDANYRQTATIMTHAGELAGTLLAPMGGKIRFGGDVAVSQATIAANVRSQLVSVGSGILALFVFLLVILSRVSAACFAVLPVTVACLAVLGTMGWLGIPVGVATSMFISITLGIGIDFPLHLLEYADRELRRGVADPVASARRAVGPAIIIDSIVVGAGFGVLVFSQVPANVRLGALVAISVLASCACTLMLARDRRSYRARQQTSVAIGPG